MSDIEYRDNGCDLQPACLSGKPPEAITGDFLLLMSTQMPSRPSRMVVFRERPAASARTRDRWIFFAVCAAPRASFSVGMPVLLRREQHQVLDPVVVLHMVDVMDVLSGGKRPPNVLHHHPDVLAHTSDRSPDADVPTAIDTPLPTSPHRMSVPRGVVMRRFRSARRGTVLPFPQFPRTAHAKRRTAYATLKEPVQFRAPHDGHSVQNPVSVCKN